MKTRIVRGVLVVATVFLLQAGRGWAAEGVPSQEPAPGTAPAMNNKDQNNPPGPADQQTASMSPGTKHPRLHRPRGVEPVSNQAGLNDTKSPQDLRAPATNVP